MTKESTPDSGDYDFIDFNPGRQEDPTATNQLPTNQTESDKEQPPTTKQTGICRTFSTVIKGFHF